MISNDPVEDRPQSAQNCSNATIRLFVLIERKNVRVNRFQQLFQMSKEINSTEMISVRIRWEEVIWCTIYETTSGTLNA